MSNKIKPFEVCFASPGTRNGGSRNQPRWAARIERSRGQPWLDTEPPTPTCVAHERRIKPLSLNAEHQAKPRQASMTLVANSSEN